MDFSSLFRQHRLQRGLSVVALSQATGLAKTTLENWQAGRTLPSSVELETLIPALELSSVEQRVLRRAVGLPRAIAKLPEGERPPLTGGLLRAMRLRRGLSQSEVARQLSVRQGTLAKWEKSDDWPEVDKLSQVCSVLEATHPEAEAILGGVFLPLFRSESASLDDLQEHATLLAERINQQPNDPLLDLSLFELESQLWLTADCPSTQQLLWRVWSYHCNYLSVNHRYEEMLPYLNQMLAVSFDPNKPETSCLQSAVILKAKALRGSPRSSREHTVRRQRSIAFLNAQQARVGDPECQAWYWMELVSLLSAEGAYDQAKSCLVRSNAIPHHQCERGTMGESGLMTAYHLAKLGSPREALALLHSPTLGQDDYSFSPLMRMRWHLYHAHALEMLDDTRSALNELEVLFDQIAATGISTLRGEAEALMMELLRLP